MRAGGKLRPVFLPMVLVLVSRRRTPAWLRSDVAMLACGSLQPTRHSGAGRNSVTTPCAQTWEQELPAFRLQTSAVATGFRPAPEWRGWSAGL